jgi:hypothetical protein
MELTRYNNQLPEIKGIPKGVLSESEKKIVMLSQAKRFCDIRPDEFNVIVLQAMAMIKINLQHKENAPRNDAEAKAMQEERSSLAIAIVSMINDKYFTLSVEEFKTAIARGSRGDYKKDNEVLFLSPAMINSWIHSYIEQTKKPVMAKVIAKREPEKVELTQKQKDEIVINGIISKFEEFKKTGQIIDMGNNAYNTLKGLGYINVSDEDKKRIKEAAIKQLQVENERARTKTLVPSQMKELNVAFEHLLSGTGNDIQVRCREIALVEYFQHCILSNIDIASQLTQNMKEGEV